MAYRSADGRKYSNARHRVSPVNNREAAAGVIVDDDAPGATKKFGMLCVFGASKV
jgi:hypothetical protein